MILYYIVIRKSKKKTMKIIITRFLRVFVFKFSSTMIKVSETIYDVETGRFHFVKTQC